MSTTKTPEVKKPARHVITVSAERHAAIAEAAKLHGVTAQVITDIMLEIGLAPINRNNVSALVTSHKASRPLDKLVGELTEDQKRAVAEFIAGGCRFDEDQ